MIQRLSLLIGLLSAVAIGLFFSSTVNAQSGPQRPFPQHVTYAPGTLRPTNFTQAQQDDHVRTFYQYWKSAYLVAAGTDPNGQPRYRVKFAKSGADAAATVSEGQGYGLVITALMAGYDPNAQTLFDGLWRFAKAYPSGGNNKLMTWKVKNGAPVEGNDSAFDGDADIAYGLLLAHAQWGSAGAINYQAEAAGVIDAILTATIGPASHLPMLGDWVNPGGGQYNQYTPRSSDLMLAHFRTFSRVTNQSAWETVVAYSQAVINRLQMAYSPATGLLPDFMVHCNPISSCAPAPVGFLEGNYDGHYYYNAGRDPWRIGVDALLNADATAKAAVQKMGRWVAANSGGNASNIKAGYRLDGAAIDTYFTTFFVAPFGVAAMTDPTQQAFLNSIYAKVYSVHENYYEDTVNLLALLIMTGNYWDPVPAATPTATIFADGFEAGNLNAWSASVTDGSDLQASVNAALVGAFGLQANINDNNNLYVTADQPNGETGYQVRFRFDPNSLRMANNDLHTLFYGYTGAATQVLRLDLRYATGQYQLRAALRDDGALWKNSSWFTISDAPHLLQLNWQAATMAVANNGTLAFRIDDVLKSNLTGVDNDTRRIDRVRLGAILGIDTGTRGSYFFDDFASYPSTAPAMAALTDTAPAEDNSATFEEVTAEELAAEQAEAALSQQLFLPLVVR